MIRKLILTGLSLVTAMALPQAVNAETVYEKVARTGILTVGTTFDVVPYSYIDADGNLVGYSVDVVKLIQQQLSAELGKDIIIQRLEAPDPISRIPLLESGKIDIACDSQFTWERDRHVDFSISYGVSGIRVLSFAGSGLDEPDSLAGKRIAIVENSVGADVMKLVQPQATFVPVTSAPEALQLLESKQVDAVGGDTVALAGLITAAENDEVFELAPFVPYERFGLACMVPEGNSTFLNTVNYTIGTMAQGYLAEEQPYADIINGWFGPNGLISLPEGLLQDFFRSVLIQRAQVRPISDL
ncbi:MAG: extracellular substrate binding-like orphan protein GrrP [Cyanobacteria bacterium P01_H01_bin.15]